MAGVIDISFESNIREWTASMVAFERQQLPFATAKALTDVARLDVKPAIERQIDAVFVKPVEFTRRGVAYRPANKSGLASKVLIMNVQQSYLEIEEYGGVRTPKKRALAMPAGQKVNAYGNLPRGTVQRLLARRDTFSGRVNGHGGIWQRTRKGLKLLVAWRDQASYSPRFGFYETARAAAELHFPRRFDAALSQALASAR
ncbi:hypothetical protein [Mesorhizobium sp. B1-1-2]|uniref:hypothetical protein n=1 Tax=Mesorhizobium sp. B1-1-2 TaxID=2589982 RepID=UPI00112CD72C|nr:hypothetical protein [Mesorhizobium sp. B1-1-2]TPN79975.1 hypothetical protein FJ985_01715 [Mesorhizobium sp. B1-1-2]